VKRDLVLQVDPELYPLIEGSADSEVLFFLALSLGLQDDPARAVARTIGLVEQVGHAHGVEYPFQGTIAATDGERLWAFRYSSEGRSRTLFFTSAYETLKELYPDDPRLELFDEETRLIVSEPLVDLPGVWNEAPEASYGILQPGKDELHPFRPEA
jgi:glutamine amidotransferase